MDESSRVRPEDAFGPTVAAGARADAAFAATAALDAGTTIVPTAHTERAALDAALEALARLRDGGESLSFEAVLGQGGMGTVHLARQFALHRAVAVKSVRQEARSPAATLKLLREAWITGALEHPHVVPVYDLRLDADGQPQIVLKKVEGAPWSRWLHDPDGVRTRFGGRDPLVWNLRVLLDVMAAVEHAHRRGIVHRDLKPENVMIGAHGEVYVVDWGIAVAVVDDGSGRLPLARDATELAGTPAYMAPEMVGTGPAIDTRTDVYLLGAMLLEVATGRPPRDVSNLAELVEALSAPLSIPESASPELARIVERATAVDPGARYADVAAMRASVEAFLEHRGSLALTDDAEARLEALERELSAPDADAEPDAVRMRVYHLFGECRFGFQQALRSWPENPRARAGLERAIRRMVEVELAAADPRSAAVLAASLAEPDVALAARIEAARTAAEAEAARLASLARDLDPSVGKRTRAFVALVMTTVWTLGPLAAWWLVERDPAAESPEAALVFTFGIAAIGWALAFWAQESLSKSAINRAVVRVSALALGGQVMLLVGALLGGLTMLGVQLALYVVWSICVGALAITADARFGWASLGYAVGLLAAAARPDLRFLVDAVTNLGLMVTVARVWGRDADFDGYAWERDDFRARAWRAFLERNRNAEARERAPGPP